MCVCVFFYEGYNLSKGQTDRQTDTYFFNGLYALNQGYLYGQTNNELQDRIEVIPSIEFRRIEVILTSMGRGNGKFLYREVHQPKF